MTLQNEKPELEVRKTELLKQEEELKIQLAKLEESLLEVCVCLLFRNYAVLCMTVVHSDSRTFEQFLNFGLHLGFFCIVFSRFWVSLGILCTVCPLLLLCWFSFVSCQEISSEQCLQNDLFCDEWDTKP